MGDFLLAVKNINHKYILVGGIVYIMNRKMQYYFGAIVSYFAIAFNIVAGLIYTPWMVEKIGQSNYALYTLASSFISIFLVDFGLSSVVSRFVAKYRAEGKEEKADKLLGIVTKLYLIIDACILISLIIVFFLLEKIYKGLTPHELQVYKQLYIIVGTYSVLSFPFMPLSGIISAYEKFIQLKLCDLCQKIITIVLVVIALINNLGVVAVVTANAVSGILIIIVKLFTIYGMTPVRYNFRVSDRILLKEIFSFSVWTTVMSIAQRFVFNLAPTILGVFSTSTEISVFAPANTLEGYFFTFAAAVNGMFLAKISKYIADNQKDKIFNLMVKIGRYQLIILGLILVGFVCVGKDFMMLWMGEDYVAAWPCAILMFIPDLLIFTQQIANTTAIAENYVKNIALGYVGMAVISGTLSIFLCQSYGALGSSVAITIAYGFLYIYMNVIYYKILKLDVFKFYKLCYVRHIPSIILSIVLGYYTANYLIVISGWKGLFLKGISIVCIYFAFVLICGLSKVEKKQVYYKIRCLFNH